MANKFKPGDKVVVIVAQDSIQCGMRGTVVYSPNDVGPNRYFVDFGPSWHRNAGGYGHDCRGTIPGGTGYSIREPNLAIDVPPTPIEEAANEYIEGELRNA